MDNQQEVSADASKTHAPGETRPPAQQTPGDDKPSVPKSEQK